MMYNNPFKYFYKNEMLQKTLTILFTPSLDSKLPNPFFPKHPRNYINRGVQVPFLLGFTNSEGSLFIDSNIFKYRFIIHLLLFR
jgi:carboxylesterase type B